METTKDLILAAKIVSVHGIKGLVKIDVYLDNAKDFESYQFGSNWLND